MATACSTALLAVSEKSVPTTTFVYTGSPPVSTWADGNRPDGRPPRIPAHNERREPRVRSARCGPRRAWEQPVPGRLLHAGRQVADDRAHRHALRDRLQRALPR